jgi:signal peptidase II
VAEAERIIGTPDTPDSARARQDRPEENASPGEPSGSEGAAGPAGGSGTDGVERADGVFGEDSARAAAGAAAPAGAEPSRGRRRVAVLFTIAAVAYAFDLISKMLVVSELEHHDSVEVVGDWLKFEAVRNAGAAFGFGEAFTVIFTVIAAIVIVVIARLARQLYSTPWAIALGLLLGGALGNLTDRIFRSPGVFKGAVVDFIAPKHFAVFNLADSAIVCGGVLIVLLSFRGLDPDGTVHKD